MKYAYLVIFLIASAMQGVMALEYSHRVNVRDYMSIVEVRCAYRENVRYIIVQIVQNLDEQYPDRVFPVAGTVVLPDPEPEYAETVVLELPSLKLNEPEFKAWVELKGQIASQQSIESSE